MIWFARILGAGLLAAVWTLLGLMGLWLALFALTPPGWFLAPILAVMAYQMFRRVRRHRAAMLLAYLEQAVTLNLPLPPMLAAAERSESGVLKQRLAAVRIHLECGATIGDALDTVARDLSPRAGTLLVSAERLGRLPPMLRYLLKQDRRKQRRENPDDAVAIGYAAGLLVTMWLVMGGAMIFIVPKLREIFDDFEVALPAMTRQLIGVSQWMTGMSSGQSFPGILLIIAAVVMAMVLAILMRFTPSGRTVCGHLAWYLPVLHGLARDRSLADVCRLVSDATEAGVPLSDALAESSRVEVNPVIRHRLRACAQACEAGAPIADAARTARLPSVMAGLLGTGEASSNVPRAFDFLARYYGNRFNRAYEVLKQAAKPTVILTLALPVAWIALGLFQPLVTLIESVLPMGLL